MKSKVLQRPFVAQLEQQLLCLRDPRYGYRALLVYLAGAAEPWEFSAQGEIVGLRQFGGTGAPELLVRNAARCAANLGDGPAHGQGEDGWAGDSRAGGIRVTPPQTVLP